VPVVPPSQISVQIVKSMSYRGSTKEWSNRWFFNQTTLPSDSDKNAIAATIFAQEQIQYTSAVTFVRHVWRAAGSDVPVFSNTLSGSGTLSLTSKARCPGDCASLLRFSTSQRTSKNHPIYLFKYFHDPIYLTSGSPDTLDTTQSGRILALGNMFVSGIVQGGVTYKVAGPHGAVGLGAFVEPLITHRDFPR
jgi:hypothetical protein